MTDGPVSPDGNDGASRSELPKQTIAETEKKPPGNVKVGFLYRPHIVVTAEHIAISEKELTDRFTEFFSPGDNNVLLLEQSMGDPTRDQRFQEAYERHKSFRKAQIVNASKREVPNIDGFIPVLEAKLFDNPGQTTEQAQGAYYWLVYKVLDKLVEQGYPVKLVFEQGATPNDEEVSKDLPYAEYKKALTKFAEHGLGRDKGIAQHTTDLVEEAEQEEGQTNIAGLFGSNHEIVSSLLPERIRAVTTTHTDSYTGATQDAPRNRIIKLIKEGKKVPESVWLSEYHGEGHRVAKTVSRLTSLVKRQS